MNVVFASSLNSILPATLTPGTLPSLILFVSFLSFPLFILLSLPFPSSDCPLPSFPSPFLPLPSLPFPSLPSFFPSFSPLLHSFSSAVSSLLCSSPCSFLPNAPQEYSLFSFLSSLLHPPPLLPFCINA